MDKKPLIIVPFALPWDWSADYQRKTCEELSKRGYSVYAYMWNDAHFFLKKQKKQYSTVTNVSFFTPKFILPLRRIKTIEWLNHQLCLLFFAATTFGKKKIIWTFDPQFHSFSKFFWPAKLLYDCVDAHHTEDLHHEQRLLKNADTVVVNSHALKKLHKNYLPILVPQGFNALDFFSYTKDEVVKINQIVIGYIGGINYRLDFLLLTQLIAQSPDWKFEFWGPIQSSKQDVLHKTEEKVALLKKFQNVTFHHTSNKHTLIKHMQQFTVGIIPYSATLRINRYSYPMKLFEYLYVGLPVVSTPVLELQQNKFINHVYCAATANEFKSMIRHTLTTNQTTILRDQRKKLAISNSWEKKITQVLNVIM